MQSAAIPSKYEECWNCDTLQLKRYCRCPLLRCTVKIIMQEAWTCEERSMIFCSCSHEDCVASVKVDSFKVFVSTLWHTMLFFQQKQSPECGFQSFYLDAPSKLNSTANNACLILSSAFLFANHKQTSSSSIQF